MKAEPSLPANGAIADAREAVLEILSWAREEAIEHSSWVYKAHVLSWDVLKVTFIFVFCFRLAACCPCMLSSEFLSAAMIKSRES